MLKSADNQNFGKNQREIEVNLLIQSKIVFENSITLCYFNESILNFKSQCY